MFLTSVLGSHVTQVTVYISSMLQHFTGIACQFLHLCILTAVVKEKTTILCSYSVTNLKAFAFLVISDVMYKQQNP